MRLKVKEEECDVAERKGSGGDVSEVEVESIVVVRGRVVREVVLHPGVRILSYNPNLSAQI